MVKEDISLSLIILVNKGGIILIKSKIYWGLNSRGVLKIIILYLITYKI